MLNLYLAPILASRGIDKPFGWLRKNGFTHNTAHRLLQKPLVLSLGYLEKLCRLLYCTPNDLLQFTPSADTSLSPGHPLNQLIKKEEAGNLAQHLRTLPQQDLNKVWILLNDLKKSNGEGEEAT